MKQTQRLSKEACNTIISKEKTRRALEKLGPESKGRLRAELGKFQIPSEKAEQEKYLEAVAGIVQNTIGRRIRGFSDISSPDIQEKLLENMFDQRLRSVTNAISIALNASQICEYAQFLGRDGFNPDAFLRSIKLFSNGREIRFKEISQKKKDIRQEIVSAAEKKDKGSLSKLMQLLNENIHSLKDDPGAVFEVAALLCNDTKKVRALLKMQDPETYDMLKMMSEEGQGGVLFSDMHSAAEQVFLLRSLLQFGIYTDPENGECILYDKYFKINGIRGYVAKDKEDLYKRRLGGFAIGMEMLVAEKQHVQHELQHIFDNATLTLGEKGSEAEGEYRAYLAELAFYPEQRIERCAQFMNGDMKKMLLLSIFEDTDMDPHETAKAQVGLKMRHINPQSDAEVEKAAKKLINEEYKEKTGLSYDEIIEPFRKKRIGDSI